MSILDEDIFKITDDTLIFDAVKFYLHQFNKVYSTDTLVWEGYYREPAKTEEVYIFVSRPKNHSNIRRILFVPERYWVKKNNKNKYGYKTHGQYQCDYDYLNKNYTRVCRSKESVIKNQDEWSWRYRYAKKSDKIGVTLNYIKEMSWVS